MDNKEFNLDNAEDARKFLDIPSKKGALLRAVVIGDEVVQISDLTDEQIIEVAKTFKKTNEP